MQNFNKDIKLMKLSIFSSSMKINFAGWTKIERQDYFFANK